MKHGKVIERIIKSLPLKTIRYYFGKEIAIGFIEGVLRQANIYDVYEMIENNRYNLFDGNEKAKKFIIKSRKLLLDNEKIIREAVTPKNVMDVLKESRPDIYGLIINHKKGRQWVENTIKESLNYLFRLANSA